MGRKSRRRERFEQGMPMTMVVHEVTGWELADHLALKDYLEAHELLPPSMEAMPGFDIEPMIAVLGRPEATVAERKRALVFLAHHRSARAAEVLRGQLSKVDPALSRFARLAYEEALQWAPSQVGRQDVDDFGAGEVMRWQL